MVEALRAGLGHITSPVLKIINAHVDANIKQVETKSEIDAQELWDRSRVRTENDCVRHQSNLESIVSGSTKYFGITVDTPRIEQSPEAAEDWVYRFIDYAKDVGEKEMQAVWSRILAGELENPGFVPVRALHLVSLMDRSDALLFQLACSCALEINYKQRILLVDPESLPELSRYGVDGGTIQTLCNAGLIGNNLPYSFEMTGTEMYRGPLGARIIVSLHGKKYGFRGDGENENRYSGHHFTEAGNCLAALIEVPMNPDYIDALMNRRDTFLVELDAV